MFLDFLDLLLLPSPASKQKSKLKARVFFAKFHPILKLVCHVNWVGQGYFLRNTNSGMVMITQNEGPPWSLASFVSLELPLQGFQRLDRSVKRKSGKRRVSQ